MAKMTRQRSLGATAVNARPLRIDVQRLGDSWNVFLRWGTRRRRIGAPLSVALVDEARKHGQDPVEDLVEKAMQLADRWTAIGTVSRR